MAGYATWEEYNNDYLLGRAPTIPETEFNYWIREASNKIDYYTFDRLISTYMMELYNDELIECSCKLAEFLYGTNNVAMESAGISSVSITGHSITYDKTDGNSIADKAKDIVSLYFAHTGLMFRGTL